MAVKKSINYLFQKNEQKKKKYRRMCPQDMDAPASNQCKKCVHRTWMPPPPPNVKSDQV
jgi:hypothetical protein